MQRICTKDLLLLLYCYNNKQTTDSFLFNYSNHPPFCVLYIKSSSFFFNGKVFISLDVIFLIESSKIPCNTQPEDLWLLHQTILNNINVYYRLYNIFLYRIYTYIYIQLYLWATRKTTFLRKHHFIFFSLYFLFGFLSISIIFIPLVSPDHLSSSIYI